MSPFFILVKKNQWRTQDVAKGSHNRGSGGKTPNRRILKGPRGIAPSRQQSFAVPSALFIEKGHAVTADNAKIFLQLMSKSRSLAKTSERRLQS